MRESFAKIIGASNYVAGILGEIWNLNTNHILTDTSTGWTGYRKVDIRFDNGKRISKTVHRLVYEAFNGPIPNRLVINHIDEDKTNNSLSNLEMMTRADNIRYGNRSEKQKLSRKNGTGLRKEYNKNRKFTRSAAVIEKHKEISKAYWNQVYAG